MLTLTGAPDLKVYDSLLTGGWRGCDDGHRRHAVPHACSRGSLTSGAVRILSA